MPGNRPAADQHLCFHYIDSTITLLPKFKYVNVYSFMDRFSHETAHLIMAINNSCAVIENESIYNCY